MAQEQPRNGVNIVQGEMSLVVSAMRRNARWASHSHQVINGFCCLVVLGNSLGYVVQYGVVLEEIRRVKGSKIEYFLSQHFKVAAQRSTLYLQLFKLILILNSGCISDSKVTVYGQYIDM